MTIDRCPSRLTRVARALGVDRAVGFTLLARGWDLTSKTVHLYIVVQFLTVEEQGYYYTFASVLAVSVFFELGVGAAIQTFMSYEAGRLTVGPGGVLEGDPHAVRRQAALFRKSLQWYGFVAVVTATIILAAGWFMFARRGGESSVNWEAAWLVTVAHAAGSAVLTPAKLLLTGMGRLAELARLSIWVSLIGSVVGWGLMIAGYGLVSLPIASVAGLVFTACSLWASHGPLLSSLWTQPDTHGAISWRRELWPFQWRIALSWLSGYFIYQLFTPVAFAFQGARTAAQVGFSLSLLNQVQSVGLIWLSVKTPTFGALISRRAYPALDRLFVRVMGVSLAVTSLGVSLIIACGVFVNVCEYKLAERLLPPALLALLGLVCVLNVFIIGIASYLRSYKREPFLVASLVSAALTGGSTYVLGRWTGATAMIVGYASITVFVGLPWTIWLYFSCRHEFRKLNDASGVSNSPAAGLPGDQDVVPCVSVPGDRD